MCEEMDDVWIEIMRKSLKSDTVWMFLRTFAVLRGTMHVEHLH